LITCAGTPTAVVPFESRTEELAHFHGIPVLRPGADATCSDVLDLFGSLDFSEIGRRQADNFPNWLSFLRENGLETVFDRLGSSVENRNEFPLERTLPCFYPDDDLRAWKSNPPAVQIRIGTAIAVKRTGMSIRRAARRIKKTFAN
jgi:hypothetical protein